MMRSNKWPCSVFVPLLYHSHPHDQLSQLLAGIEHAGGPTTPGRESLEAGDRQQPSGNGGAALKSASLLPDIKEHIAQKILGHGLVADEPEQPTIEFSAMPGEQHLHGKRVTRCNALNQNFVG